VTPEVPDEVDPELPVPDEPPVPDDVVVPEESVLGELVPEELVLVFDVVFVAPVAATTAVTAIVPDRAAAATAAVSRRARRAPVTRSGTVRMGDLLQSRCRSADTSPVGLLCDHDSPTMTAADMSTLCGTSGLAVRAVGARIVGIDKKPRGSGGNRRRRDPHRRHMAAPPPRRRDPHHDRRRGTARVGSVTTGVAVAGGALSVVVALGLAASQVATAGATVTPAVSPPESAASVAVHQPVRDGRYQPDLRELGLPGTSAARAVRNSPRHRGR
jgi:hypothetical protein